MRVDIHPDPYDVAVAAADAVCLLLADRPDAVIGLPTGSTPEPLYRELVERAAAGGVRLDLARWVQLDEWLGLPPGHSATCAGWLRSHFYAPAGIPSAQVLAINSDPADVKAEVDRAAAALEDLGGLDLAILGIGANGHLGLNEPEEGLVGGVHVEELAPSSRDHPMLGEYRGRVTHGITLGVSDMLATRRGVLALATGRGKARIVHRLLAGDITTHVPASLLRLVRGARLVLDRAAAEQSHP